MRRPRSRTDETNCRRDRRQQLTGQRACAHGGLRLPAATLESIAPRVAAGRQVPAFSSKGSVDRAFFWPRRRGPQQRLPLPREHRGGKRAHKPRGLCGLVRAATRRACVVQDEPQPCLVDRSVYQKFNKSWQLRKPLSAYSKVWRGATILQRTSTPSGNREGSRVARARAPQRRRQRDRLTVSGYSPDSRYFDGWMAQVDTR